MKNESEKSKQISESIKQSIRKKMEQASKLEVWPKDTPAKSNETKPKK